MNKDNEDVCSMCEGDGYITRDYETGDCICCEGRGFIIKEDYEEC